MDPWIALLVFVAYTLTDALYTFYTLAIVKGHKFIASSTGMIMYLLIAAGTINYTDNAWYVLPMALGGFAGTYISLVISEKLNKEKMT